VDRGLHRVHPGRDGLESRGNIDQRATIGVSRHSTINLDPLGWKGAKIDANATYEISSSRTR
jgi:hypothetical protein